MGTLFDNAASFFRTDEGVKRRQEQQMWDAFMTFFLAFKKSNWHKQISFEPVLYITRCLLLNNLKGPLKHQSLAIVTTIFTQKILL